MCVYSDAIPQSSLPIEERPLIHLFLISEDMEMDTLEAVCLRSSFVNRSTMLMDVE